MTLMKLIAKRQYQWVILIDGYPVEGTNAYSRKRALENFCKGNRDWKSYTDAGYKVVRVHLSQ